MTHMVHGANIEDDGKTLVLRVDMTEKGTRSVSGKTLIVAKTLGPQQIPETDVTLNMQLWRK